MSKPYLFNIGDFVLYTGKSKISSLSKRVGKTGKVLKIFRESVCGEITNCYRVTLYPESSSSIDYGEVCMEDNLELVSPKEPDWVI